MFGKSLLINLCAGLLLCSSNGFSVAMPVRRSVTKVLERELVPLVPRASIHPVHVDLMDRYENLERQVSRAVKGTPDYESLVNDLATTKQTLEDSIKGRAVWARSDTGLPVPVPSSTAASPSPSSDSASSTASASVTASASTISALPSTSVNTDVPVVTVVTQIGTSVVVVASQGVTSTITLATLTNIPSSTLSSTVPSGSSISGSASGTSPSVSTTSAALTTPSGTIAAQQDNASSAALPTALSMPKTKILLGAMMSTLFGALTVL